MKIHLLFAVLISSVTLSKAQGLAIINDQDGFVNMRSGRNINSKIITKVDENTVLVITDEDTRSGTWLELSMPAYISDYSGKTAHYSTNNYNPGYIYNNRIIPIEKLPFITSRHITNNNLTIKNDSITLFVSTQKFQTKNHKIQKDKSGFVTAIDNKRPFGVDGNIPHTEILHITLSINKLNVLIPADAYNDLFEFNLDELNVYLGKKGNIYIYVPISSDGAGYYVVVWVIKNGKLIKRYVDNSYA